MTEITIQVTSDFHDNIKPKCNSLADYATLGEEWIEKIKSKYSNPKITKLAKEVLVNATFQFNRDFSPIQSDTLGFDQIALVMKGGGIKGLAYVGAIEILEKFYNFTWYTGTSAGAITAILLGSGYNHEELQKILFRQYLVTELQPNRHLFFNDHISITEWEKCVEEMQGSLPIKRAKNVIAGFSIKPECEKKADEVIRKFHDLSHQKKLPEKYFRHSIVQTEIYKILMDLFIRIDDFKIRVLKPNHFNTKEYAETFAKSVIKLLETINIPKLTKTLEDVLNLNHFRASIFNTGVFPSAQNPKIFWMGIGRGKQKIISLHDKVKKAVSSFKEGKKVSIIKDGPKSIIAMLKYRLK